MQSVRRGSFSFYLYGSVLIEAEYPYLSKKENIFYFLKSIEKYFFRDILYLRGYINIKMYIDGRRRQYENSG